MIYIFLTRSNDQTPIRGAAVYSQFQNVCGGKSTISEIVSLTPKWGHAGGLAFFLRVVEITSQLINSSYSCSYFLFLFDYLTGHLI